MISNLQTNKGISFQAPNPRLTVYPPPLDKVEQVTQAKLLVVTFQQKAGKYKTTIEK